MKHFLLTFFATLLALTALAAESVPYSSLIDGDNWTIIDANNDSNGDNGTWISATSTDLSGSYCSKGVKYKYHSKNPADDWIISPAIHLEKGKSYKIGHKGKLYNATNERYSLYFATSLDPSDLKQDKNLVFTSVGNIANTSWNTLSNSITPEEDGDYYFGFYCFSDVDKFYVYITDFSVTEYTELPGNVNNLEIAPGEQGVMKATLTWTWPENNNLGGSMTTKLTGARIHRTVSRNPSATEENKIAEITLTDPADPGSLYIWEDTTFPEDSKAQTYYYLVIPYNENGECPSSYPTSASCWIGADTGVGKATKGSVYLDEADPTVVIVDFNPPKGTNGGWVDLSTVGYNIYRYNGAFVQGVNYELLETDYKGSLPYRDSGITKLGKYSYCIKVVVNGKEQTGNNENFGTIIAGPVPSIPYDEPFDNSASLDVFTTFKGSSGISTINDWSGSSVSGNYAASLLTGTYYYTKDAWLVTPGIQMEGGKTYVMKFDSWGSQSNLMDKYGEIYVYVGQGTTEEAFTEPCGVFTISNNTREIKEARFKVEENGIYNIAFRDYVPTNLKYGSVTVYLDNINIDYLPIAPLAPTEGEAKADNQGGLKVDLKWVNPTEDNQGGTLSTIDKIEVYRSTKGNTEQTLLTTFDNQTPGETVEYTDENIPEKGFYTYYIKPYLGQETYDFATIDSDWVGEDELAPVKNVVAKMSSDNFNNIEVTFVSEGANGGYLDYDNITYKITRITNGATNSEETIKEGLKYDELPYIDQGPGLNAYTYKVFVTGLATDKGVVSNKVVGGGMADLPYSNTFDSRPSIELFTLGHSAATTNDWDWNNSAIAYFRTSSNASDNDAWAITPPFEFKGGGSYTVSFKPSVSSTTYPKDLGVYIVSSLDPSEWGEAKLQEKISQTSAYAEVRNVNFEIEEDGVYYVVFRSGGSFTVTYNYLYVDNLTVERTDRAPLAVENLAAAYDETGAMKAKLTWTNPTMDNKGDALTSIDKIEIIRNGVVVGSLDTAEVGGEGTYEDTIEDGEPGFYRYTVVAYLGEVAGKKAEEVKVWLGPDELKAPENISVTLDVSGMPKITYDAVESGKNGGYINKEAVLYRIYRGGSQIAEGISDTSYIDDDSSLTGGNYIYGVQAYIDENESEITNAASFKYVAIVDLPVEYDFTKQGDDALWQLTGWRYNSGRLRSDGSSANEWAISEPFRAESGTITLDLELAVEGQRYPQTINIYLMKDASNKTTGLLESQEGHLVDYNVEAKDTKTFNFELNEDGVYYLGLQNLNTNNWYTFVYSAKITQSEVADPEKPAAPASIQVSLLEDGSRYITFDEVTTNANGEVLDAEITYTLYLDNVELVSGLTTTTYTDNSEGELGKHQYSVKAVNGDKESKLTVSEPLVFGGALSLPYIPDYSTASTFDFWTFVNGEPGPNTWKYNASEKRLYTGYASDAWAITPPLKVKKGTGKISLRYRTYNGTREEKLEIYLLSNIDDRENGILLDSRIISSGLEKDLVIEDIEFPQSGTYYIAFRENSDDPYYIYLYKSDIEQTSIEEEEPTVEPLDMNYSTSFTDGDSDLWTVMGEQGAESWMFNEEESYFYTQAADVKLVSPPFRMQVGTAKLEMSVAGGHEDAEQLHIYLITESIESEEIPEEPADEPENINNVMRAPSADKETVHLVTIPVESTESTTLYHDFDIEKTGVYYLAFAATPNEGSTGVKLNSFTMQYSDTSTGVRYAYTDGSLIYNRAMQTILIPAAGRLDIFSANGALMTSVETADHVNVGNLTAGTYVARFIDKDGKVATLKFVK